MGRGRGSMCILGGCVVHGGEGVWRDIMHIIINDGLVAVGGECGLEEMLCRRELC